MILPGCVTSPILQLHSAWRMKISMARFKQVVPFIVMLLVTVLMTSQINAAEPFLLEEATIESIHQAMQDETLTAVELVERYLQRIAAYDQQGVALNSVITINPDAVNEAAELDRQFQSSGLVGSLHGIPVLLKDNVETSTLPTTGGSLSLKDYVPAQDAPIVTKLKEAGAIILAKVNLHEFAVWGETVSSLQGQTKNPYDLTRTPGGSSGGTGAAIAANFGVLGIGTDTVNSIRSPASACSLVGLRPTLGLVSRTGIIPYSLTQDTAGPITRTVSDAAKMLDAIAGYDPQDPQTAWSVGQIPETYTAFLDENGLEGARIGVLNSFFGTAPEHQEVNAVVRNAIAVMETQGAVLIPLDAPINAGELVSNVSVHLYELKDNLTTYLQNAQPSAPVQSLSDVIASGQYHPGIEETIQQAATLSTQDEEYKSRLLKRSQLQTTFLKLMADHNLDAIVFPHQQRLVVPIGESQVERQGILTSATGFPSIVVPAGFSQPSETAPIGVPIGVEWVGRPWSEPTLIKIAYAFEQATQVRRPPASTPQL
jgi:amidase